MPLNWRGSYGTLCTIENEEKGDSQMKKVTVILCLILSGMLVGCMKSDLKIKDSKAAAMASSQGAVASSCYHMAAEAENGYYFCIDGCLYYRDRGADEPVVLCSKPNCAHEDFSCNARIGHEDVFYYDGNLYLYTISPKDVFSSDLVRISPDGETHETLTSIQNLDLNSTAFFQGKLFYVVSDAETGSENLMSFDLESRKTECVYDAGGNAITLTGARGERLYFSEMGTEKNGGYMMQIRYVDLAENSVETLKVTLEGGGAPDPLLRLLYVGEERLYLAWHDENVQTSDAVRIVSCSPDGSDAVVLMELKNGLLDADGTYIYAQEGSDLAIYDLEGQEEGRYALRNGDESVMMVFCINAQASDTVFVCGWEIEITAGDSDHSVHQILELPKALIGTEGCSLKPVVRQEEE